MLVSQCLSSVVKSKNSVGEPIVPLLTEMKLMSLRERLAHLPESHLHTSTPEEQILGIAQPYDSSQVLKMTKPETRGRGVTIYGAIGGWRKESGRQT